MYVHPKNSKHLLSHSRAIMALDHSRLGLENKFLESKSGRIFFAFDRLLYKFFPTNLRLCKPTFYTFYTSHLRWNSTFYQTGLGQNTAFHNFSMFRMINRGVLAKPFKKFPKSPYGQPVLIFSASCQCGQVFEWTLMEIRINIITNLLSSFLYYYLMVPVITMCNLIKRLIGATFLSTPASDVHERWKQTPQTSD